MAYTVVNSTFVKPRKEEHYIGHSLEEKVQKLLDEGWKLQGGVGVGLGGHGFKGNQHSEEVTIIFAQAMVKN